MKGHIFMLLTLADWWWGDMHHLELEPTPSTTR